MGSSAATSQLWPEVLRTYDKAQASGAAIKMETQVQVLTDPNLQLEYVIRVASALKQKPTGAVAAAAAAAPAAERQQVQQAATSAAPPAAASAPSAPSAAAAGAGAAVDAPKPAWRNPFLPYEEALWIRHLSPSHTLLLNKFNVVAHHVLVITRQFESQQDPLNERDLGAVWGVLQATPLGGLAFFNCGEHSGRSQPHKHMQVVPLPFLDGHAPVPPMQHHVDRAVAGAAPYVPVGVRSLPFRSYAARLDAASATAEKLASTFDALLAKVRAGVLGAAAAAATSQQQHHVSFNALMTRDFMMLIPRSTECCGPLAINSLGFGGTILVKSEDEAQFVREVGPTHVLTQVGFTWEQHPQHSML